MTDPHAICAGCHRTAAEVGEYNEENPVEEDGTFADGKFVCTACYIKLIAVGQDVGPPRLLQQRIKALVHPS